MVSINHNCECIESGECSCFEDMCSCDCECTDCTHEQELISQEDMCPCGGSCLCGGTTEEFDLI